MTNDLATTVATAQRNVHDEARRRLVRWAQTHPSATLADLEGQADLIAADLLTAEVERLSRGGEHDDRTAPNA